MLRKLSDKSSCIIGYSCSWNDALQALKGSKEELKTSAGSAEGWGPTKGEGVTDGLSKVIVCLVLLCSASPNQSFGSELHVLVEAI